MKLSQLRPITPVANSSVSNCSGPCIWIYFLFYVKISAYLLQISRLNLLLYKMIIFHIALIGSDDEDDQAVGDPKAVLPDISSDEEGDNELRAKERDRDGGWV